MGRVAEAESALAAFQREAAAAGDGEAEVMVTARHAMLAVLHGRFDRAVELIKEVAVLARRAGMADAEALTGSLAWSVALERSTGTAEQSALMDLFTGGQPGPQTLAGTPGWAAQPGVSSPGEAAVKYLLAVASRQPGHLFEATAARMLVWLGRDAEAAAELERLLPRALASALRKLERASQVVPSQTAQPAFAHLYLVNPLSGRTFSSLFSTHPPLDERIRRLEAMAASQPHR